MVGGREILCWVVYVENAQNQNIQKTLGSLVRPADK